jgi:hypothetical protein
MFTFRDDENEQYSPRISGGQNNDFGFTFVARCKTKMDVVFQFNRKFMQNKADVSTAS